MFEQFPAPPGATVGILLVEGEAGRGGWLATWGQGWGCLLLGSRVGLGLLLLVILGHGWCSLLVGEGLRSVRFTQSG